VDQARVLNSLESLEKNINRVIRGKPHVVRFALIALLSQGHMLIEDVPGVGKTTLANSLAKSVDLAFKRIQFTSDLMPSDILGVSVLDQASGEFKFKPGPIFTNVLLADEINRATPKTQSALLEAMNESRVTVDGRTYLLPKPFFVIATQNPHEYRGTFPLPENQLDRFALRISIGYPDRESEKEILTSPIHSVYTDSLRPVIDKDELLAMQQMVERVFVDDAIVNYMLQIVSLTRNPQYFELGVSPRGTIALKRAAQARALIDGRSFCIPDDVKEMVIPVLAHRIIPKRERFGSRGIEEEVLRELVETIEVPI
jgi:MoxR-like ATPase